MITPEAQLAFNAVVRVIERNLEPIFKKGTKLSVIARTPDNPEADVLVTADSIEELRALLDRSEKREATR